MSVSLSSPNVHHSDGILTLVPPPSPDQLLRADHCARARIDFTLLVRHDLGQPSFSLPDAGPLEWPAATIFGYIWTLDRDYTDHRDRAVLRFWGQCPDCLAKCWSYPVRALEDFYRLKANFLGTTSHDCRPIRVAREGGR